MMNTEYNNKTQLKLYELKSIDVIYILADYRLTEIWWSFAFLA